MSILTKEQILKSQHISNSEVEQDLRDTEKEIKDYQDELNVLMRNQIENKVRIYFLEGKIFQRRIFCQKLNEILEYRNAQIK